MRSLDTVSKYLIPLNRPSQICFLIFSLERVFICIIIHLNMAESSRDDTPCDQTSIAQKFPEEEDSDTNGKNLPENPYRCTVNGVQMVWVGNAWVPDVEINEDFLACYNASYGIQYDYSSIPAPETSKNQAGKETSGQDTKKLTKEEREIRKREAAERAKNWVEIEDQKNTNVYVSGLPTNITEDEFIVSVPVHNKYTIYFKHVVSTSSFLVSRERRDPPFPKNNHFSVQNLPNRIISLLNKTFKTFFYLRAQNKKLY